MKHLMRLAMPLALSLAACSAKVDSRPVEDIFADRPQAAIELGRNNGRPFKMTKAVLLEHFGDKNLLNLVLYGEKVTAPCFGLGDVMAIAPVSRTPLVGRNVYSTTRADWMVQLYDVTDGVRRDVSVPGGSVEVFTFDGKNGTAFIDVGQPGGKDSLRGDISFENCVVGGW